MNPLRTIRTAVRTAILVALVSGAAACRSTPTAIEVTKRGPGAVVGTWLSELDGARIAFASDGTFELSRGADAIRGAWRVEGDSIVLAHEDGTGPCGGSEGLYRPEIVRDTMRLAIGRDECLWREELMAWPWTRP
jgi:hypothetical protein